MKLIKLIKFPYLEQNRSDLCVLCYREGPLSCPLRCENRRVIIGIFHENLDQHRGHLSETAELENSIFRKF